MAHERCRDYAATSNAADHQAVRAAEERDQEVERERLGFYEQVMGTVAGRAVIWDLISRAGIYSSIFHPSGSQLYYNSGRQDFGLEILATVEPLERLYLAMETEARERVRFRRAQIAADSTPAAGSTKHEE